MRWVRHEHICPWPHITEGHQWTCRLWHWRRPYFYRCSLHPSTQVWVSDDPPETWGQVVRRELRWSWSHRREYWHHSRDQWKLSLRRRYRTIRWWVIGGPLVACLCVGCTKAHVPFAVSTFPEPTIMEDRQAVEVVPAPVEAWPLIPTGKHSLQQIDLANKASVIVPTAADFRRGTAVLPWKSGAIYGLDCAPEQAMTLTLGPTEELKFVPRTGERWQIEPVTEVFPHRLIIAPLEPTLRTRLVVVTSLRLITIDLRANAKTSLVEVQWELPPVSASRPVVTAHRYGIGYGISEGSYSWKPSYAWDDGRHVFVLFPESLLSGDAPVVAIRSGGERQLVNYRLHGVMMRIDRLLPPGDTLELQVGPDPAVRVDVQRMAEYRTMTCPGEPLCRFVQGWLIEEGTHARTYP